MLQITKTAEMKKIILLSALSICFSIVCGGPMQSTRYEKGRLLLPDVIYATVGLESNIYFDNISLCVNPANWVFDVECEKGIQQSERWTLIPSAKDVGEYALAVKMLDGNNAVIAEGKTVLRVIPAEAGSGKKVSLLCIGDSLTYMSWYCQDLLELSQQYKSPVIELIGTNAKKSAFHPGNKHEGYGGWTAKRFVTDDKSPFLFNGKLDFQEYCRKNNNGKAPDFVTIFLGCNDIFNSVDANFNQMAEDMFKYYDQLVAMVRQANKKTRIGLVLPVPPAGTQDAFGANYACSQTRWQYKCNQHKLVELMLKKYSNREKENIFIIPAYLNLDCMNGYPVSSYPANSRTEHMANRLNNGVHPSKDGFYQIGDSIYAWLKAMLFDYKQQVVHNGM